MKIYIYGDSNTWGYIPNIDGYSKDAIPVRYEKNDIWWYPLSLQHEVFVNGLCGRAINNDNPWLEGRNAMRTIDGDKENIVNSHLIIIQLGTNDCKSKYGQSAKEIALQMGELIDKIRGYSSAKVMLISPAIIRSGNKITDKYYVGGESKSIELSKQYKKLCEQNGLAFISGLDLDVGVDGEHLTKDGHRMLGKKVLFEVEKFMKSRKLF